MLDFKKAKLAMDSKEARKGNVYALLGLFFLMIGWLISHLGMIVISLILFMMGIAFHMDSWMRYYVYDAV